ncbi:hypothetical protein CI102_12164 [Trichoderma harzianum]|nr:hypothetical protein CI102_12164 [Trichoderma harzianum]
MLKVPMFCRIRSGDLHTNEAMAYSKLNYDKGRQSLDSGHEKAWTPRFARRGAANAANGGAFLSFLIPPFMSLIFFSWLVLIRFCGQMTRRIHPYLNEIAKFDLQNAFLEEEKQDWLFRMFAHVSSMRDLGPHGIYVELPAARRRKRYASSQKRLGPKGQSVRRDSFKDYREYYFYNRPTWEIEAQARGELKERYEDPVIDLTIYDRAKLAEFLCYQPKDLTEEQILRNRIEVVDLMVALCNNRDTGKVSQTRSRPPVHPPPSNLSRRSLLASKPGTSPIPFLFLWMQVIVRIASVTSG